MSDPIHDLSVFLGAGDAGARIVIVGGPQTGKTTLAGVLGFPLEQVRHTDDLIETHGWSEASQEASTWFNEAGPWVVEGVATVRALRKWLAAHAEGLPCDVIAYLTKEHAELGGGQVGMAKGVLTVWRGIRNELVARGVQIIGDPLG